MKRTLSILLTGLFVLTMAASASAAASLKLGHSTDGNEGIFQKGSEKFAELLAKYSNGSIEIKIYPNSTLGADTELVQGLQLGTVDMCLTDTNNIASFIPSVQVFNLPFMFKSNAMAYEVLDGEIGKNVLGGLSKARIVGLAYFENGFRNLTNSKRDVVKLEDVKGLKIRVMGSPLYIALWSALGADPTPMAWSEVYTALQQGTVDGQENPVAQIYSQKVYEVNKHITLTGHVYSPAVLLIGQTAWGKLNDDQKAAVQKAASEAAVWQRQYAADIQKKALTTMEAAGVSIMYTFDYDDFAAAAAPVVDQFAKSLGVSDIAVKINEIGAKY